MNTKPRNRLVIVNRADPVICGHSVEGRNLAEAALERGFDEVRIVTWPIERLAGHRPAAEAARPHAARTATGIIVERPEPVGDYKVPDGRYLAGITGRLVELFTDGVPTVCLSLYLSPHTVAVTDAVRARVEHRPARERHDDRRGGGVGCHERRALVRRAGPVRRRRPHPLELPRAGPLRRGLGVHARAHRRLGRRDRRVPRHARSPSSAASASASRTRRSTRRSTSTSTPTLVDGRARRPRASSATATCCSSRGSRRRRASTTSSPDSSAQPAQRATPARHRGTRTRGRGAAASSPRHRRSPTASCSSTTSTTPRSPT